MFFLSRYGRTTVVRASAVSGALGLLLVIASDNAALAGAAVLLWGLGASLGFPLALSAAGESGPDPPGSAWSPSSATSPSSSGRPASASSAST
ncbi:hypothetical protein ALMP_57310 [Streptomyces sp. A012304]|nr:hypothetical protein ALMP_57310 [Streptomyces sp. A012304]